MPLSRSSSYPSAAGFLSDRHASYISHVGKEKFQTSLNGCVMELRQSSSTHQSRWCINDENYVLTISLLESNSSTISDESVLAALDAAFIYHPAFTHLLVHAPDWTPVRLLAAGTVTTTSGRCLQANRASLWQHQDLCQTISPAPYALHHIVTEGRRHPLRAPSVIGTLYRRYIPWLQSSLSFRAIDVSHDLDSFHSWMNDPVVNEFWGEKGDLTYHRDYLAKMDADPHASSLIVCFDDIAVGYIEIYWAKEDRLGAFYDAADFDRGWHVLIGDSEFRGRPFVSAWMPSISHYLFLADCRTQRIVIEPRIDNTKMSRSLARCGYAQVKEIEFPHKRAMLGVLLRERFFSEGLWRPLDHDSKRSDFS